VNVRESRGSCGFSWVFETGGALGVLDVYRRRALVRIRGTLVHELALKMRPDSGMRAVVKSRASKDIEKI
jgi:hypothetical protein